jgi:hypothetical protein
MDSFFTKTMNEAKLPYVKKSIAADFRALEISEKESLQHVALTVDQLSMLGWTMARVRLIDIKRTEQWNRSFV